MLTNKLINHKTVVIDTIGITRMFAIIHSKFVFHINSNIIGNVHIIAHNVGSIMSFKKLYPNFQIKVFLTLS